MKVMSREFTTTEKILIVVLAIVLFGLLYYKFVFLTTNEMVQSLKSQVETAQTDLDVATARLTQLQQVKKEMDALNQSGNVSRMESYNNSKEETAFLNQVLSDVSDYSISFSEVTREGDQIRRSFSLQFVTGSYDKAVKVVEELSYGELRCLVDDINYSLNNNNDIYINLTATFFETMVGGTPDAALPPDESAEDVEGEGVSIDDFN